MSPKLEDVGSYSIGVTLTDSAATRPLSSSFIITLIVIPPGSSATTN